MKRNIVIHQCLEEKKKKKKKKKRKVCLRKEKHDIINDNPINSPSVVSSQSSLPLFYRDSDVTVHDSCLLHSPEMTFLMISCIPSLCTLVWTGTVETIGHGGCLVPCHLLCLHFTRRHAPCRPLASFAFVPEQWANACCATNILLPVDPSVLSSQSVSLPTNTTYYPTFHTTNMRKFLCIYQYQKSP